MIPDYNRVVLGNVSSITPNQLKQLKDNQMYLDWHFDKQPKGVIAKVENKATVEAERDGNPTGPGNVAMFPGTPQLPCSIVAGRIYRILIINNGVGESPNVSRGTIPVGQYYIGGQVHLNDAHGNRIGTWWVAGDLQNAANPGLGSWIPLEAIYLSTETNASFHFDAFIDVATSYTYTPFDGTGHDLGPQTMVGWDWQWFAPADLTTPGHSVDVSFQMIVEDMGAYTNDPWQYISGG